MKSEDLEGAIARYRDELQAEAELATGDLDEVEDHLRALIEDLRTAGATADVAFATAVQRLGAARDVARECARVRPAFGARLPALRSWSAAALFVPPIAIGLWKYHALMGGTTIALYVVIAIAFGVGLVLRRSWARAGVLGIAAGDLASWALATSLDSTAYLQIAASLGVVGFLAPWRRGEVSRSGWALAALGFGSSGISTLGVFARNMIESQPATVTTAAIVACVAAATGLAGLLVRARWATPVLAVGATAMAAALVPMSRGYVELQLNFGLSAVMMATAAALSWRGARSGWGNLRALA